MVGQHSSSTHRSKLDSVAYYFFLKNILIKKMKIFFNDRKLTGSRELG